MLGVYIKNLVALTTCGPGLVHHPTSILQTHVREYSPVSCFRMYNAVRYEVRVQLGKEIFFNIYQCTLTNYLRL